MHLCIYCLVQCNKRQIVSETGCLVCGTKVKVSATIEPLPSVQLNLGKEGIVARHGRQRNFVHIITALPSMNTKGIGQDDKLKASDVEFKCKYHLVVTSIYTMLVKVQKRATGNLP